MKRIVSILLSLSLCLGLLPTALPAKAASVNDLTYKITDGQVTITECNQYATGEMNIPDTIEGYLVTGIGSSAFFACSSLASVTIPESVTSIGAWAFFACSSLASMTIPEGVTTIGDCAFGFCSSLTSVTIPEGVISIGDLAFADCSSLTSMTIPNGVTEIGFEVFNDCSSLTAIMFCGNAPAIGSDCFMDVTATAYYPAGDPSWTEDVMQDYGGDITWVPDHGKAPGVEPGVGEFSYEILDGGTCSITGFNGNDTELVIPAEIDGYLVTGIGSSAFFEFSSLTSMTIPEGVTSIGDDAFWGCSSLTSVTIPEGITSIGKSAFWGCSSLTSVTIPESITSIGAFSFERCSSLTSVTIPEGVTTIRNWTFSDCSSLTSVTIPEGVSSIGGGAFSGCNSLTDVTIPEGVSSIRGGTFDDCSSLTSVTIPDSVTSIGHYAFFNCTGLSDVYYTGTQEQWSEINIDDGNSYLLNATIHYNSTGEDPEAKKSIAVLASEKSLTVETGDSMTLAFGVMNMDTGMLEGEWRKMALAVSDPTVISLSDYEYTEYGYSLEVIGKKEGTTHLTVTDTETGINTIILITVRDSFVQTYSYAIDDMKVFYPKNDFEDHIATNVYDLNGMYVNNYHAVENDDGSHTVTFDVYNSRYYYGAVDIYDENGMWLEFEEIKKFSDIDSVYDTGKQLLYLISESATFAATLGKESSLLTYQGSSFSTKTEIEIKVPKNGYFTISNNVAASPGTFVVNSLEILFDAAFTFVDAATSGVNKVSAFDDILKETKKDFTQKLLDARNESLKNEVKRKAQKVMLDSMQSEVKKTLKKSAQKDIIEQLSVMSETSAELAGLLDRSLFAEYEIDWEGILSNTLGLGESFFNKFAGPAGLALQGCFAITKGTNKVMMVSQMAWSSNKPYVTVYSKIEEGYINPHGIIVNTEGNVEAEAVLQVFRVSNTDTLDVILDSDNPLEKHALYNICFVKDDQLVQPNGKVSVRIPVPVGMNSNTCKVYRQEDDGVWTILDAHVEGTYLVFETDHFSLYTVIGNMDNLSIHSMPNKTVYTDGDSLDTEGLVLDLNGELIYEGYICDPVVLSGDGSVKITVQYGDTTTEFDVIVNPSTGYAVSGNIESRGNKADNITLHLINAQGVAQTMVTSSGSYTFEDVAVGTYTLEASKANYVTRRYTVTIQTNSVTQDVLLCMVGDITGDGKINVADTSRAYAHVRGTGTLAEYALLCADVSNDGKINIADTSKIYAHVRGTAMLLETDPVKILAAAEALADNAKLPYKVTLSGKVILVDSYYDPEYKNISFSISVDGTLGKTLLCYRVKGDDASKVVVNDQVTVEGTIMKYNGTIELVNGNLTGWTSGGKTVPSDQKQIVDEAYALDPGATLPYTATLTGRIVSIDTEYSEMYKNITVTIVVDGKDDKPIKCYRMKGDAAAMLAMGDVITVRGTIKNYQHSSGECEIQFDMGCKLEMIVSDATV